MFFQYSISTCHVEIWKCLKITGLWDVPMCRQRRTEFCWAQKIIVSKIGFNFVLFLATLSAIKLLANTLTGTNALSIRLRKRSTNRIESWCNLDLDWWSFSFLLSSMLKDLYSMWLIYLGHVLFSFQIEYMVPIRQNSDRGARVIFLGLKFDKTSFFWGWSKLRLVFGVEKITVIFGFIEDLRYFLGLSKICIIFLGYQKEMY